MYKLQKEFSLGLATMRAKVKLKDVTDTKNHENLLGFASITLTTDFGTFTVSGFRIWKSKYDDFKGINLTVPMAGQFKQVAASKPLMSAMQKVVNEAYEDANIPIVN